MAGEDSIKGGVIGNIVQVSEGKTLPEICRGNQL
jgi:hypothetical protein